MGELSLRTLVPDALRAGGCCLDRVEVKTFEGSAVEESASRLRRACSSCSALILDFSSSTPRPFLFVQESVGDKDSKFGHVVLLENPYNKNRCEIDPLTLLLACVASQRISTRSPRRLCNIDGDP